MLKGKRVTIYVKDPSDWDSVMKESYRLSAESGKRASAGRYLVNLHKANLGRQDSQKPAQPEKFGSHKFNNLDPGPFYCTECKKSHGALNSAGMCCGQHELTDSGLSVSALVEPDHVEKMKKNLQKKQPKRTKDDKCSECGSRFGHRIGCFEREI